MTTVRELIKDSTFIKAKGFENLNPELSIILPTYARGDNGLFEQCLKSLLEQNFKKFELIIIDDASVDSTANIIKKYMETDSRIAVIRHKKNIGLPAVSSIEGYLKCRANRIAFAFDDNSFEKEGIEKLMQDQYKNPEHLVSYGYTNMLEQNGKVKKIPDRAVTYAGLFKDSYIGNSSLLIHKKVIEDIGFYDPHFATMRVADWDLWRRISKKYDFHLVDSIIVNEYGPTQSDSLGNSVGYDKFVVQRHVQLNRNISLLPSNFLDYSFDIIPRNVGFYYKLALSDIVSKRFQGKYNLKEMTQKNDGYIICVVAAIKEKDTLCFSTLTNNIFYVTQSELYNNFNAYMFGANALVFSKMIPEQKLIDKLEMLHCEYYCFVDDSPFEHPELKLNFYFNDTNAFIEKAKALIATSPQACKEIEKYFHKKTHLISEFETDEIKRIMNKNVKPFALNILKSSYNERYNIKKFLKTLKYTLFYYVKGKQKKYTSPVRYNAKRLYNTFWETLAYYALKMRK